jgi:TolB-like protein/tetratricopeptide (TPR) repeat protein
MSGLRDLIREVQRRSIWWALGAYIAVAFLVFELIKQIGESADQPWLPNVALVLLLIGLPVVIGTALVRDRPVEGANETPGQASRVPISAEPAALFNARNTVVAGVLVAAAVFTVMNTGTWPMGGDAGVEVATTLGDASVVVLPLDNIGGREEVAYLSEGITEQITAQLAKVPELKVISRTSAETVMGYNLTIPEIADRLGVEHVVEGSVQLFEDQIRVTAQLIHAETDEHLWADSYDGQLQDLFALQEDIAIQVASALTSAVGGVREISSASRTEDPVAHEAYLIGKSQLHRRSEANMLAAIESFERSMAQDPNYAPAYAGLAMAYGLFIAWGHPELNGYELHSRGVRMANRAIELDNDSAEGYLARGYLETQAFGRYEPTASDFERALELSPNSADAHGWYAHLLVREGHDDEALAQNEMAIEIDPLAPGRRMGAALAAIGSRRNNAAATAAQRGLALGPTLELGRYLEALAHLLARKLDDCLNVLGDRYPGVRAMCQYSQGDEAAALQVIDSLKNTVSSTSVPQNHSEMLSYRELAMFYAWVGNVDETLEWLERAFAWSPYAVQFEIMRSGVFDRVNEDPGFQSGLERIQAQARQRLIQAGG